MPNYLPRTFSIWQEWLESVDHALMRQYLKAGPAKTVVEAAPLPESEGGILLAEESAWKLRPDIGVVIDNTPLPCGKAKGIDVKPGDLVVLRKRSGKRLGNLVFPGYKPSGEIRLYGCMGGSLLNDKTRGVAMVSPQAISPSECVMAVINETLEATGENVVIELMEPKSESNGILLPERAQKICPVATVISVGPNARDINPDLEIGQKHIFHEGDLTDDIFLWGDKKFAIRHASLLYAAID
jgi:co-chaperonin GroES (HSP10)